MLNSIGDLIEPDTDDDKKFNLSLKQLQFIQQDNNVKFMNNIIKSMKQYKLEVEDINIGAGFARPYGVSYADAHIIY